MNTRRTAGALVAAALTMAACGGTAPITEPAATSAETTTPAATPSATPSDDTASIDVKAGSTDLGEVLTSPDGLTLYGFTNDVDATSTCDGTCADAWPPLVVDADWTAGPGLDFGIFATTTRDDGQDQLVAGKWPLYTFSGDAAPGDVAGQGSGGVWFAVATDGSLITEGAEVASEGESGPTEAAAASQEDAPVATAETSLGATLVDVDGLTLYGFTDDVDAVPTCADACADAWPPLVIDGDTLPAGLDEDVFQVVERPDGTFQLAAGPWPLYRFAGDASPGDVAGQGSGGVWFAVDDEGGLIDAEGEETAASDDGY